MSIFTELYDYFSFPFVRYAFVVGILISLCSALLGVTLVLKRYSFIGDGLSHVAFGALAIATVFGISNNMLVIMPITIASAILLLRMGQNAKIKGDAAIAMISVGALAIGYLLLNVFPSSSNVSGDVCSTLFGSTNFITLSSTDMWVCVIMSLLVILAYCFFYNKIFAVTFDENFTRGVGVKAELYNLLIATVTAAVIVLAMKLVGSLLIAALIIFPAISAMRVLKSFKAVVIASGIISVSASAVGLILSILYSTPAGATIVAVDIAVLGIFSVIGAITKRK
ncbi:MAG: metal ABC transporter permease [Clostridia bacterium]|nr:metal ABC transporter permease [Clostridia bacterium]